MATPPVSPEAPVVAPAAIGPLGRVTGVFFSPTPTFDDIVRKPSWVLPVALLTLMSLAVSVAINQRTNWREFMADQLDKNPATAQLSPEQREQRIEAGAKFSPPFTYAIGLIGPVLAFLVVALVMWGAYNLLGGAGTNFGTSFAVTTHAFLTGIVSSLLFLLVLFLKPPGTVDLQNPVATNLAVLLPADAAKWLVALCKSIDIFSFWTLLLLAIGFAATSPRKLKGSKSLSIALTVWAAFVLIKVGWAFIAP